jgi:hypothetical protein
MQTMMQNGIGVFTLDVKGPDGLLGLSIASFVYNHGRDTGNGPESFEWRDNKIMEESRLGLKRT